MPSRVWGSVEKEEEGPEEGAPITASTVLWKGNNAGVVLSHVTSNTCVHSNYEKYVFVYTFSNRHCFFNENLYLLAPRFAFRVLESL